MIVFRLFWVAVMFAVPFSMMVGLAGPGVAQDALELQGTCDTCHGTNGKTKGPLIPRLAGQRQKYLEKQIRDFRTAARGAETENLSSIAGSRSHPKLKVDFKGLTDAQITRLAAAYAGEACINPSAPPPAIPPKAMECLACHDDRSTSHGAWVARLSGQNKSYLLNQIYALQIAKREGDDAKNLTRRHPVMEDRVGNLSQLQVEQLAEFFSRLSCR